MNIQALTQKKFSFESSLYCLALNNFHSPSANELKKSSGVNLNEIGSAESVEQRLSRLSEDKAADLYEQR